HGGAGPIYTATGRQPHGVLPHCARTHRKHNAMGRMAAGVCFCRARFTDRLPRTGFVAAALSRLLTTKSSNTEPPTRRGELMKIRKLLGALSCTLAALTMAPAATAADYKSE